MNQSGFQSLVDHGARIHFVGIGGVSMSCIAETLFIKGARVSGSDMQESAAVSRLRALGIAVSVGHRAENVEDADLVIYTAAIKQDNEELREARRLNIPVMERAEALGHQMRGHKEVLCVAGTHGKSTTTAMASSVALKNGDDVTIMVGADYNAIGGGYRLGDGSLFIAEACEYSDSFLQFCPTVALILNVDSDHLDYFGSIENIRLSFRKFVELLPANGRLVVNCEDKNAMLAMEGIDRETFTFGMNDGDFHTRDLAFEGGRARFTLMYKNEALTEISLNVFGGHNALNAVGAAASMFILGTPPAAIAAGLNDFTGTGRRMERRGVFNGATVMDDYAHHPSEITAVLKTARQMGFGRIICAFQPHTYSRLQAQMADFADALKLADLAIITDVYAAREKPVEGIDAKALAKQIPGAVVAPSLDDVLEEIKRVAAEGDLIITMGAGSISRVASMLTEKS